MKESEYKTKSGRRYYERRAKRLESLLGYAFNYTDRLRLGNKVGEA